MVVWDPAPRWRGYDCTPCAAWRLWLECHCWRWPSGAWLRCSDFQGPCWLSGNWGRSLFFCIEEAERSAPVSDGVSGLPCVTVLVEGGVVGREGVWLKVGGGLLGYSWGGFKRGTDRVWIAILVRFGGEVPRATCVTQGCMGGAMGGSRLLIGCSMSRFCSVFMCGGGDP